jgi:hypothetical protein
MAKKDKERGQRPLSFLALRQSIALDAQNGFE